MKKFLLIISIFTAYLFIMCVILPVYVDPFNVFHYKNIRPSTTEPNRNYIKMRYILDNPGKFDGFLFGSSRAGALHTETMKGGRIYSLTYSLAIPHEYLDNLRTLLKAGIKPKIIYIGLDYLSYTETSERHIIQPMRCPYEYLRDNPEHFYTLYLNPASVWNSLKLMRKNKGKSSESAKNFYDFGWWWDYGIKTKFMEDKKVPQYTKVNNDKIFDRNAIEQTLNDLKSIADICRHNEIKLVLFTNPLYFTTHMRGIDRDFFDFLEGLSEFSEFYNFSSINSISLNRKNYLDDSHYIPEVGDMIINVICYGAKYNKLYEQGFGVKVSQDNINKFISKLKKQAEEIALNNM